MQIWHILQGIRPSAECRAWKIPSRLQYSKAGHALDPHVEPIAYLSLARGLPFPPKSNRTNALDLSNALFEIILHTYERDDANKSCAALSTHLSARAAANSQGPHSYQNILIYSLSSVVFATFFDYQIPGWIRKAPPHNRWWRWCLIGYCHTVERDREREIRLYCALDCVFDDQKERKRLCPNFDWALFFFFLSFTALL